jgi:Zn-dependent M28 family amino/carboxypeptidase
VTVQIVFFAGEEERALGSWHFARSGALVPPAAVINLEVVGATEQLAYVAEERSALEVFRPSPALVALVGNAVRDRWGETLQPATFPTGSLTDARNFIRHGVPAITLMSAMSGGWPRRLHSLHDHRDRLSLPALQHTVELLVEVLSAVDAQPEILRATR